MKPHALKALYCPESWNTFGCHVYLNRQLSKPNRTCIGTIKIVHLQRSRSLDSFISLYFFYYFRRGDVQSQHSIELVQTNLAANK